MTTTTRAPHPTLASLPAAVVDVFNHFFTAELTTVGREGAPITWPIMPIFWARRGLFVTLSSIGLPQKAFNIRRNPQVALLFSDSTGSELTHPPTVLVQGEATVADGIFTSPAEADPELYEVILTQALKMIQRQPAMSFYMSSPITRYLMDWYFMRLVITIKPRSILWWEGGEAQASLASHRLEVSNVD